MRTSISEHNQACWNGRRSGWAYRNASGLFPAETTLIGLLRGERDDWRVLDIGIGSGRTTPHLCELGRSYVGVDYSSEMIRVARQRFPGADIRRADARRMTDFADRRFDAVWFSFNGIDYASHADRLAILAEVARVLAPGGAFCFSAHNRDFAGLERTTAVRPPALTANPMRLALRTVRYLQAQVHARRLKAREVATSDYSLINDDAQEHRFLTYYIGVPGQAAQLAQAGFATIAAFGKNGERLDVSQPYDADYMVHYLARRAG